MDKIDNISLQINNIERGINDIGGSISDIPELSEVLAYRIDDIAQRIRDLGQDHLNTITSQLNGLQRSARASSSWSGLQAVFLAAILWRVW